MADISSGEGIHEGANSEAIDVGNEKARKGGSNLYCEKHEEVIKLHCKTHEEDVCHLCATICHQQPCERDYIGDEFIKNKNELKDLKKRAEDKLKLHRDYGDQIHQCRRDTDIHLQDLKDEVDSVINEAIQTDKDIENEVAERINHEFDEKKKEEIRKNDEERGRRLELNRTNAEKRRELIANKQHGLQKDIDKIAEEKEIKIAELEKTCQDDTKATENTIQKLDTLLKDDKKVAKDGLSLNTTVSGELEKPLNEGEVKQITDTISNVKFVKGAGREKYDGRIDWEWKLIDKIYVKGKITSPAIVGCKDECNVIITDRLGSPHTYMLDTNTTRTHRLITSSGTSGVNSCALLNNDKVVCGKYSKGCTRNNLNRCISVYDRQWKHINDIIIPRNTSRDTTCVDVAADQDGIIIAAEWDQSKIYVINPTDGKIMNTITCKQNMRMQGVLSSGHIIARPSPPDHRVFIIDRQGAQREIPHSDFSCNTCTDPMTDDLYVATYDDERKTCVIDQVMGGDGMMKRRVASFPLSSNLITMAHRVDHLGSSRVMMTSSGNMIVSDGEHILVFKKPLSL